MAFSNRRGRPSAPKLMRDKGTPELQAKRKIGATLEPLDSCVRRGILTDAQHRAGLHLRWLYTLRFGAPSVRSVEFDRVAGAHDHTVHEEDWKEAREKEYRTAIAGLAELKADGIVLDICVLNRAPRFLRHEGFNAVQETHFRDAMAWLAHHWRMEKLHKNS